MVLFKVNRFWDSNKHDPFYVGDFLIVCKGGSFRKSTFTQERFCEKSVVDSTGSLGAIFQVKNILN